MTNLIGNGVATIAVARWEGAIDMKTARAVLNQDEDPDVDDKRRAQADANPVAQGGEPVTRPRIR